MPNTLTGLAPFIYEAVDVVSREMVGLVPAVSISASADRVALNQDVTYSVVPDMVAQDLVPAARVPDWTDTDVDVGTMRLTKQRKVPWYWTGDDQRRVDAMGLRAIQDSKLAQAIRTLVNEMEADLAALYVHASRVYGTAGATPFATAGDFSDVAQVRRILMDNGAPLTGLQLVMNTAASANLLSKQVRADIQGSDSMLRSGVLLDIHGVQLRESAQIKTHTKGTGANYLVDDAANYAAGATTVHVDTGTGSFVAGDVVSFADDASAGGYVVGTGFAGDGDGDIVINAPGLTGAVLNNKAVTIGNNYTANMAFARSAIHLLTRLPLRPESGDLATDVMMVTDERSGITFEFATYKGYYGETLQVAASWGVKANKPEHMALLLG